jgi:cobalt-zinc-cadmium efflux system membrane fusion protein
VNGYLMWKFEMSKPRRAAVTVLLGLLIVAAVACSHEAPPAPTKSEATLDPGVFDVQNPERFKLDKVQTRSLPTELTANGSVTPDVARTIHVTSMGSGRVAEIRAHLGDSVHKGQVLLVISSPDSAQANSDYRKAVADEVLSNKALERAQLLLSHGALAEKDLQVAEDAEAKAKVDVETSAERVRILGGDPAHPSPLIEVRAPISGAIVEQNVAGSEGVKSLDNTPNLFTIADLTSVWVVCDVYENDIGDVHIGDGAEVHLNAFPDRVFHGKIVDISRVLDPATRSAKVRIVLGNSDGALRPGMFATANFRSNKLQDHTVIPATALMRLQDKDWVFRADGANRFRRVEVQAGGLTSDGMQEIRQGVSAGDSVVVNALEFSSAVAGN